MHRSHTLLSISVLLTLTFAFTPCAHANVQLLPGIANASACGYVNAPQYCKTNYTVNALASLTAPNPPGLIADSYASAFPSQWKAGALVAAGQEGEVYANGHLCCGGKADAGATVFWDVEDKTTGQQAYNQVQSLAFSGAATAAIPCANPNACGDTWGTWSVSVTDPVTGMPLVAISGIAHSQQPNVVTIYTNWPKPHLLSLPTSDLTDTIYFNSPDAMFNESVGAHAFVLGSAGIDPIITPVNPNTELISLSPLNPVPDPLFTPAVINNLAAQGLDFSAFYAEGLIGGSPTPEPSTLISLGSGLVVLAAVARRRGRSGPAPAPCSFPSSTSTRLRKNS